MSVPSCGSLSRLRRKSGRCLPRPFLKWAGGKVQLLRDLLAFVPSRFGAYHEPFVGGGALFFALHRAGRLENRKAHLSDANLELVTTYRAIRDDVDTVLALLEKHRHDRDHFYAVRAQDPASLSPAEQAARMIFLNKTGFNGLYRVNRSGRFNVPFGRHTNPTICDRENLLAASRALQGVEVTCEGFETVLSRAQSGDFIYFDPPYVPLSRTANFTSYARDGFDLPDQERLAQVVCALAKRQVAVMLSNSDTPWVRERYRDFHQVRLLARRHVNCRASGRAPVGERLVLSYVERQGNQLER